MAIGKTNAQDKSTNYWQVQKIEDASFHFKKNDSGYWVNTNAATGNNNANTAAVCKVFFRMAQTDNITFTISQDSESGCDYGIIGALDTELTLTDTVDSTVLKSFKNVSGTQTFTTNIPKGEHFVYIKYRKDNSASNGTDTFQFTITSGATEIESEDGVDVSGVTATAADVLDGKYFIDSSGTLQEGNIVNRTSNPTVTMELKYEEGLAEPRYYIPAGYYDGNQYPYMDNHDYTLLPGDVRPGAKYINMAGQVFDGGMPDARWVMNLSYNSETGYIEAPLYILEDGYLQTTDSITAKKTPAELGLSTGELNCKQYTSTGTYVNSTSTKLSFNDSQGLFNEIDSVSDIKLIDISMKSGNQVYAFLNGAFEIYSAHIDLINSKAFLTGIGVSNGITTGGAYSFSSLGSYIQVSQSSNNIVIAFSGIVTSIGYALLSNTSNFTSFSYNVNIYY